MLFGAGQINIIFNNYRPDSNSLMGRNM